MEMERTSVRHGPRVDDELKEEIEPLLRGAPIEPRVEEALEKEPAGEDEPEPQEMLQDDGEWQGQSITAQDVRDRSELATYLEPARFPATREELIGAARSHSSPDWVVQSLSRLPAVGQYENMEAVWRALGGPEEQRD